MKDLEEASYILGIKLTQDRRNRILNLSQETCIKKIVAKYGMEDSKKGLIPFQTWNRSIYKAVSYHTCRYRIHEGGSLCFGSRKPHVWHAMLWARYLLCGRHGERITVKPRISSMDYCQIHIQVSSENDGLWIVLSGRGSDSDRVHWLRIPSR